MVKISLEGSSLFNKILIELAQTYKLWLDDRPSFFNGTRQEESIIRVINPSFQISNSLRNKYRIRQLYHSAESLSIVKKLAIIIRKCCNLKCLAYELHKVIDEILYEYVNTVFIDFLDSVDHNGTFFNIRSDILEKVINEKVTFFKNNFSKYSYKFPVTVFNLNEEVRLSKNIFLKPIDSEELN
ncbi:hypothetical protein [uncultured Pluralibacter sp.]|uniref:hypothetical protein n=1 Tax=uncultured Pluralibacter sp. TaxID=1490864 RepID=UPI00261EAEDD|nr:hypothetical protein [uncultured Pluralibacter sp.]